MPKKPKTRNDLFAALTALVNDDVEEFHVPPGFKTVREFEDIFGVGQRQTYIYLERLAASRQAEKKSFKILQVSIVGLCRITSSARKRFRLFGSCNADGKPGDRLAS